MKIKKSTRYIFAGILIIAMISIILSIFLRYHVKPTDVFYIEKENLIEDGSFENFNDSAYDCCDNSPGESKVFLSKSEDAFDGKYSINVSSLGHCSCISKKIKKIYSNEKLILSFYYKGDNARLCNWVSKDEKCMPYKQFEMEENWTPYKNMILLSKNSTESRILFYTDSDGEKMFSNLYDDLQVHKVVQMDNSYIFKDSEDYIITTDLSNIVHNGEPLNNEGYYLVTGKPDITLKFPWTELVILLFMMLVVIRLLFKKEIIKTEKIITKNIMKIETNIK